MILQIAETQPEILTTSKAVPFYYCGYIKPFTKALFLTFKDVDIVYQAQKYEGCTLRRMVCFTKNRRTLLMAENKPKLSIQTSNDKALYIRFMDQGKVMIQPDEYCILHSGMEYSSVILTEGTQEIIRLEFTLEALTQERLLTTTSEWRTNFEQEKSWPYGSGKITDTLRQQLDDIINIPEAKPIFGTRCQNILLQIAADQASHISA